MYKVSKKSKIKLMIVKIQQSIESSDNVKRCLIYDKHRKFMHESDDPEQVEVIAEMLGSDLKGYFKALVEDDGEGGQKIAIVERVEDQDW